MNINDYSIVPNVNAIYKPVYDLLLGFFVVNIAVYGFGYELKYTFNRGRFAALLSLF